MNKRLLISFAAIMGAMTSFAYNVGEYVYTHDAKFKVVGENILTNGNFSSNYDGWKDYADGALSPDYWSIETGAAQDGKGNVIRVLMLLPILQATICIRQFLSSLVIVMLSPLR